MTAALLVAFAGTGFAAPSTTRQVAAAKAAAGCSKQYTRGMFHTAARKALSDLHLTRFEKRTVRRVVRCQGSARSRRVVREHWRKYKRAWRIRRQWAYYRSRPMPRCTWANESGKPWESPEWAPSARYYVFNTAGSGARGKYQVMPSTWAAHGGGVSWAPLEQERVARSVLASQGIGAWSGCG